VTRSREAGEETGDVRGERSGLHYCLSSFLLLTVKSATLVLLS